MVGLTGMSGVGHLCGMVSGTGVTSGWHAGSVFQKRQETGSFNSGGVAKRLEH